MSENAKLLNIYLNDHYLGASGGVALARRIAKAHDQTAFGPELTALSKDIDSDLSSLLSLMERLEVQVQKWRGPLGAAAEKAGRLKLNGHILSRSPLSSVFELEALLAGVEGKRCGWRTLHRLAHNDDRLDSQELDNLINRSLAQTDVLERVRSWAVDEAFIASAVPSP
jgi:hypothetical protein